MTTFQKQLCDTFKRLMVCYIDISGANILDMKRFRRIKYPLSDQKFPTHNRIVLLYCCKKYIII